jgi:hypothetical protein
MDFGGAGTYNATNNDFVSFNGFGAGSFITKLGAASLIPSFCAGKFRDEHAGV